MKIIRAASLLLAIVARAEVTTFPVVPSATDPKSKQFDDPRWIYVNHGLFTGGQAEGQKDRHDLLLWLTGTGGKGHDAQDLFEACGGAGYHEVTLMFPNVSPASACQTSLDLYADGIDHHEQRWTIPTTPWYSSSS